MSTTRSALKRAANAFTKAMEAQRYGVHGKPFVCRLCGQDQFKVGSGRTSMTGLHTLECAACSHVEFFAKAPPILKDNAS